MRKLYFIWVFMFISTIVLSYVGYTPFESQIENKGVTFSLYTSSFEDFGLELGYFDYHSLYIENKIFNRTIKLKSGESFFKAFVNLPVYNSEFGLGYEYKLENNFLGVLTLKNFQRVEVKNFDHDIYNFTQAKFNVPSYAIGNLFLFNNKNINLFEVKARIYRPLEIPISLGYSNGFYFNIPIVNLDLYYVDTIEVGMSLIQQKWYPNIGFSIPINIFDQHLHMGTRIAFGQDFFYEFYLYNENLKLPLLFSFNEKGGSLFFEF
ncbi:hypothetical protein [Petrotoga olearia]|uniref:Uncharacterized protein n=2 Tax=Petrotoga olearia TaxID=156203 RepID=A0A2K1NXC5_9BACT|nr:hypothetical protein [Petrotoga olearia]PNR95174.1 hypothetical protein X929_09460 [Petrotoga olearia DSM 13574]RMA72894.1 hypothetical protein C8D75_1179 [Petrotoga olearia]